MPRITLGVGISTRVEVFLLTYPQLAVTLLHQVVRRFRTVITSAAPHASARASLQRGSAVQLGLQAPRMSGRADGGVEVKGRT
jgi:hypothetical protein